MLFRPNLFVLGKNSTKRSIRPTSPNSRAFESAEGSDDEDDTLTEDTKLSSVYLHANGNVVST